jgi:hypothetical protein
LSDDKRVRVRAAKSAKRGSKRLREGGKAKRGVCGRFTACADELQQKPLKPNDPAVFNSSEVKRASEVTV